MTETAYKNTSLKYQQIYIQISAFKLKNSFALIQTLHYVHTGLSSSGVKGQSLFKSLQIQVYSCGKKVSGQLMHL